jgi:amidophosphoribosyltransferase
MACDRNFRGAHDCASRTQRTAHFSQYFVCRRAACGRGNTSRKIVEMAREAGAKKVYFASASPPVTGPCPYGVDIPTTEELIGANHTIDEVRAFIGADGLFYAKVDDMVKSIRAGNRTLKQLCTGCFNGRYPTPEVNKKLLLEMATVRNTTRDAGIEAEEPAGALAWLW